MGRCRCRHGNNKAGTYVRIVVVLNNQTATLLGHFVSSISERTVVIIIQHNHRRRYAEALSLSVACGRVWVRLCVSSVDISRLPYMPYKIIKFAHVRLYGFAFGNVTHTERPLSLWFPLFSSFFHCIVMHALRSAVECRRKNKSGRFVSAECWNVFIKVICDLVFFLFAMAGLAGWWRAVGMEEWWLNWSFTMSFIGSGRLWVGVIWKNVMYVIVSKERRKSS